MQRDSLLSFSPNTASGRIGNIFLSFLGPVGLPFFSFIIVWAMIRFPYPATYFFLLFHMLVYVLYIGSGQFWAFAAGALATLVGFLGFLFSESFLSKALFGLNASLIWVVLYLVNRIDLNRQTVYNRLEEECDRLDLDITRLSSDNEKAREDISDSREQMAAYHRLQCFTDELIGTYNREELLLRAQRGMETMFPKANVLLRLFPKPDSPADDDNWGKRVLAWAQPKLFPSRHMPSPTWTPGRSIFIPLRVRENMIGWIGLESKKEDRFFQVQDLRLAAIATDLISMALGNADRYAQTEALAISDALTGIFTRGYFDERFQEEFAKARHNATPLSLVLADIDFFKKINDVHGHNMGDEVLKWLSRNIAAQARETDFVARYGGEEFIILMPNTNTAEAQNFAKRLRKNIASSVFRWGTKKIRVTLSLGVSSLTPDLINRLDLIRRTDEALYRAKNTGRNRVCTYD